MWLKFRLPAERSSFFEKMGVHKVPFGTTFSLQDYCALKTRELQTLTSEEVAALKYGYDLYEYPYPVVIPYGKATVSFRNKDREISDCVEASLLSLLLYKARQFKGGMYHIDPMAFPEGRLRTFFGNCTDQIELFSRRAHDAFASLLMNLPGVCYLQPGGGGTTTYEVAPGLLNSLRVFGALVPELAKLANMKEEIEISAALDSLCHTKSPSKR